MLSLAAAALAFSIPQSSQIDVFSQPGVRLPAVVAALSAKTGRALTLDASFRNEVAVIDVTDVSVDDLMARLATASSGVWVKQSDGSERLMPDGPARQREEAALLAARRKAIQEGLAELRKNVQEQTREALAPSNRPGAGTNDDDEEVGVDLGSLVAHHVALQFGESVLQLRPGERVVYSTQPTAAQRGWNAQGFPSALMNAFVRGLNLEEGRRLGALWVIVKRQRGDLGADPQITLQFMAVDNTGQGVDGGMYSFGRDRGFEMAVAVAAEAAAESGEVTIGELTPARQAPSEPMPQLPEPKWSREYTLVGQFGAAMMRGNLSPETRDGRNVLNRPDRWDPMQFVYGEQLVFIARNTGRDLVSVLPDAPAFNNEPSKDEAWRNWLKLKNMATVTQEGSWTLAKPTHPPEARATRLDRDRLASLLEMGRTGLIVPTEEVMRFAVDLESGGGAEAMASLFFVLPEAAILQGMGGMSGNLAGVRFYLSLSDTEKKNLAAGMTLNAASLTPPARQALWEAVYWDELALARQPAKPLAADDMWGAMAGGFGTAMMSGGMGMFGRGNTTEPTLLLPQGVGGAQLAGSALQSTYLLPVDPDGSRGAFSLPLSIPDLAMFQMMMQMDESGQGGIQLQQILTHLAVGTCNRQRISIAFNPQLSASVETVTYSRPDTSRTYNVNALPDGIRTQVAGFSQSFMRRMQEMMEQMGGGSEEAVPPPARGGSTGSTGA